MKTHKPGASLVAEALAPVIRCQHLSLYWLSACVLSKDEEMSGLLRPFKKQVQQLLLMRLADNHYVPTQDELQQHLEGAPVAWLLGRRASKGVGYLELVWPLRIDKLRRAAQQSAAEKDLVELECPLVSAPLGGMTWSMVVQANWDADKKATLVGLYCVPRNAPNNLFYRCLFNIDVEGAPELSGSIDCSRILPGRQGCGRPDMFELGHMSGGWDDAAWAATGLPAEGELLLSLTVTALNYTGYVTDDTSSGSEYEPEASSDSGFE